MTLRQALSSLAARCVPLIATAVLLLSPTPSFSQEATPPPAGEPTARDLFFQGSAAYRVGDYDAAVAAWQRAYELDPRPLLLYNLGQAYERLGRLPEAVDATARYLDQADHMDVQRPDATARLASMRERLARTAIIIHSDVEGATVLIDGEDRARTPRRDPIQVEPGPHTVVVQMEGYQPFRSSVTVAAGMRAEVQVQMEPIPGSPAAVAAAAEPETEVVRPMAGYILIGAGGGAAVAGLILGITASGRADDAVYSDDSDAKSAKVMAGLGDALLFGGIAAAAGGVLWLFLGAEEVEREPTVAGDFQLRPVMGRGIVGANAEVRF